MIKGLAETNGMLPPPFILNSCTDVANLHDYYVYEVLDATKETAPSLINLLSRLERQSLQQDDPFHGVFFFTLVELLKVRYELGAPGERTKRQDFERSFKETTKRHGLEHVRGLLAPTLTQRPHP